MKPKNWVPGFLLVLPSMVLIGVFVYWLIFQNVNTSLTDKHNLNKSFVASHVGLDNYGKLFGLPYYQHTLWNLLVLSVVFIAGTMFFGVLWALLLEKGVTGEGFFRSVY